MTDPKQYTKNIYLYNLLKAATIELANDDSYLLSRFINVENQISLGSIDIEDFSRNIHKAFASSRHSFKVSRVCLSLCLPHSKKLQVISSYQNSDMPNNTMTPGYFCYVSPSTSLFSNKDSDVRIYSDIDNIINSYHSEKKPIQRSIGLLHQMGIKSGLTIPIHINEMFSGFLFLNSGETGNFDRFKDEDYILICTLKVVAKSILNLYLQKNLNLELPGFDIKAASNPDGNIFSHSRFAESFKTILSEKTSVAPEVKVKNSIIKPIFFPQADLIYLLVKVLESLGFLYTTNNFTFDVDLIDNETAIEIRLQNQLSATQEKLLRSIISTNGYAGFKIYIKDNQLIISTDVHVASHQELLSGYSVL